MSVGLHIESNNIGVTGSGIVLTRNAVWLKEGSDGVAFIQVQALNNAPIGSQLTISIPMQVSVGVRLGGVWQWSNTLVIQATPIFSRSITVKGHEQSNLLQNPTRVMLQGIVTTLIALVVFFVVVGVVAFLFLRRRGEKNLTQQKPKADSSQRLLRPTNRFCTSCGSQLTPGSKFCENCGERCT